jgi:hypothetical protein
MGLILSCILLKVKSSFGGIFCPHIHVCFLLDSYSHTLKKEAIYSFEALVDLNWIQSLVSQKLAVIENWTVCQIY